MFQAPSIGRLGQYDMGNCARIIKPSYYIVQYFEQTIYFEYNQKITVRVQFKFINIHFAIRIYHPKIYKSYFKIKEKLAEKLSITIKKYICVCGYG